MASAAPFPAPASRNAPCPCGSGRRYKECHGALDAAALALDATLREALAAQQAGGLDAAIAGYARALALAPNHFDALHMLGVAHFQRGEFETALDFIDRALAVQPGAPAAVFNRKLVQHGLAMRGAEAEIGRVLLPRLGHFVDSALPPPAQRVPWHLVLATPDADGPAMRLVDQVIASIGADDATRWRETGRPIHRDAVRWKTAEAVPGFAAIDATAGAHPRDGHVVIVGAERPPSAWWQRCAPRSVTLVVASDRAEFLALRIRELAADGRRRIALAYADAALAHRIRLPGRTIGKQP